MWSTCNVPEKQKEQSGPMLMEKLSSPCGGGEDGPHTEHEGTQLYSPVSGGVIRCGSVLEMWVGRGLCHLVALRFVCVWGFD